VKYKDEAILLKAGGFIWDMSGSTPYSIPLKPLSAEILKSIHFKLVFMIMQGQPESQKIWNMVSNLLFNI